jgi:hypothetical protein
LSITFYTAILALVDPRPRVTIRDVAVLASASAAAFPKVVSRQYGQIAGTSGTEKAAIDDLGDGAGPVTRGQRDPRVKETGY